MEELLIINASGFGRTVASLARSDVDHGRSWVVKGFLDGRRELAGPWGPVLGDPDSHVPAGNERFLCALGDPAARRRYAAPLLAKGAEFISLKTEINFAERVVHGPGCIFELRVSIGPDTVLGSFVNVLSTTIIGHDVHIGSYSQIGSFVFVGGGASIGNDVVIHPHATILPGIEIGDGAVIGAGSVVVGKVDAGITVFGNPARRFEFK